MHTVTSANMPPKVHKVLRNMGEQAISAMDIPNTAIDRHPISDMISGFAFPFAFRESERRLESYYGNCEIKWLKRGQRMATINRTPDALAKENCEKDLRDRVNEFLAFLESINETDRDISTLTLYLKQIYFCASNRLISLENSGTLVRHGCKYSGKNIAEDGQRLGISCLAYQWESVDGLLNLLGSCGVEEISREPVESYIRPVMRGSTIRKTDPVTERKLCFRNDVCLDPETLAVKKWNIQNYSPITYYFMHARPSSMDVVLRAKIKRQISIEDLAGRIPSIHPVLTQPGLNGLLERTNGQYRCTAPNTGIESVNEFSRGEKINLKYRDVPFHIIHQRVKCYRLKSESDESCLIRDTLYEPKLVFSCAGDRQELVKAIAQVTNTLLRSAEDAEQMPTQTTKVFLHHQNGRQMTVQEFQAIMRLKCEEGNLTTLLGLEDESPSQETLRNECSWLASVLERSRECRLVKRLHFNIDHLLQKLRAAAQKDNIEVSDASAVKAHNDRPNYHLRTKRRRC